MPAVKKGSLGSRKRPTPMAHVPKSVLRAEAGKRGNPVEKARRDYLRQAEARTNQRVLSIAAEQQAELENELKGDAGEDDDENAMDADGSHAEQLAAAAAAAAADDEAKMTAAATVPLKSSASTRAAAHGGDEDEDEDDDDDEDAQFINQAEYEEMDFAQEVAQALDPAEEAIMAKFMTKEPKKQINLANLIMSKIEEAERDAEEAVTMAEIQRRREEDQRAEAVAAAGGAMRPHMPIRRPTAGLNPKLTKVYRQVGLYLSKYKSGKLPKTFKIIPTLTNWEEILFLTQPYDWTPQATCAAVRVFTASLKDKQAQRFFCLVLLDKVRGDIAENKKLNYHYYMAIKKAIYKPAAFFKGFLLPLLEAGPTLRETAIVCSVLMRISIPMLHSAAAVLKIAELEYTGPASLVLRTLLEKKYALPYRVLDALVLHFVQFQRDEREMPVLWHQSLLVFVQRYKNDISEEQRDALMALLRVKKHRLITDEIRRELMTTIHADMAMDQSAGMTRDAVLKQFELAPPAPMALF